MGVSVPDDPGQAPGARNLVRILAETLLAHRDALSSGADLAAELTPRQWFGSAREAFVDSGLPKIDNNWQRVASINRDAAELVAGYNVFLNNLPELWAAYAGDPAELARLRALWEHRTGTVAEELLAAAAELDQLGHTTLAAPPVNTAPAPPPMTPEPPRREPGPDQTTSPPMQAPQPGAQQAAAAFARSYREAERLRDQMLAGERRETIPWTGWQAMGRTR
jgi:hypothetical protein